MSQVYTSKKEQAIPVFFIQAEKFSTFRAHLSHVEKKWLNTWGFQANPGQVSVLSDEDGKVSKVLYGASEKISLWEGAQIARAVPKGPTYMFENVTKEDYFFLALAWGLEQYQFLTYKTGDKKEEKKSLLWLDTEHLEALTALLEVSYEVRDWINMPACDLTPETFAEIALKIAKTHDP